MPRTFEVRGIFTRTKNYTEKKNGVPQIMSTYFDYKTQTNTTFDPSAIVSACIENGHGALLLESALLPKEFFDLSSGVTGALIHRLSLYDIHMAVVVPDTTVYSRPFQDFVREANRGKQFHFAATREEAVAWLEGS